MQTMNTYFKDCKTEQETKTAFRHLSKILHPDLGGTCELFREMETEYRNKLKSLNGSYNSKQDESEGKRQYFYDEAIEQDLINMIKALQGLDNDAFFECIQGEIEAVLESIRFRLERHGLYNLEDGKPIFDSNGNTIGEIKTIKDT